MASRTVEYIFQLIDRVSPNASKMAESVRKAETALHGMGNSFNKVESKSAAFASNERRRLDSMAEDRAVHLRKAQQQLSSFQGMAQRTAGVVNATFGAMMTFGVGKSMFSGMDHLIEKAAELKTLQEKLSFSTGGNKALVGAATEKAFNLSHKYKNTSVAENMKIIDDLRANLPEQLSHVIDSATEPFVKLHGFAKAWNGGRHSGSAEESLKDIGAAIRAGELTGNLTGELLAKHAENLMMSRVQFGDKFKIPEYFQAVQKAATALSAADATFNYADFPVLVQRLSQGGGVALMTAFQKLIGGTRMTQGTLAAWDRLGLVDHDNVKYDKKGMIDPKSVVGRKWLNDSDAYGTNLTDAIMTRLVPALSSKGGLGFLQGDKLAAAWKGGDTEGLAHILEDVRKHPEQMTQLARTLTSLGYDRNATKAFEEIILGAPSFMRDRQQRLGVRKDFDKYESYDKSKQSFGAQWTTMVSVLGGPLTDFAIRRLDNLASIMDKITQFARKNPELAKTATTIAVIGASAASAALTLAGLALSAKVLGYGLPAVVTGGLGLLAKGGLIGGAGFGLFELAKHWETAKQYIERPMKLHALWPEMPSWVKNILFDIDKTGYGRTLANGLGTMFDAPREAIDSLVSYMNDKFEDVSARFASTMQNAISKAITGDSLTGGGSSMRDWLSDLAQDRADQLKNDPGTEFTVFENLKEAARYAGVAILDGMARNWETLKAQAAKAWESIKAFFAQKFEINIALPEWLSWGPEQWAKKWEALSNRIKGGSEKTEASKFGDFSDLPSYKDQPKMFTGAMLEKVYNTNKDHWWSLPNTWANVDTEIAMEAAASAAERSAVYGNKRPSRPTMWDGAQWSPTTSEASKEIAVRTSVDLPQSVPLTGQMTVNVTGSVSGISGSSSGAVNGSIAPRGESAAPDRGRFGHN